MHIVCNVYRGYIIHSAYCRNTILCQLIFSTSVRFESTRKCATENSVFVFQFSYDDPFGDENKESSYTMYHILYNVHNASIVHIAPWGVNFKLIALQAGV